MTQQSWDKMDRTQPPQTEQVAAAVGSPLWDALCRYLEQDCGAKPTLEYSGCVVPGWNLAYKKSGRALCRLYPMAPEEGSFIALVVIGNREKQEFDLTLPALTPYTQQLFETTKDKNGLCWLMFEVAEQAVLDDVKTCVAIRRGAAAGRP